MARPQITGFGVELEFTLAFHEDLLLEILRKRDYPTDIIVKTFTKAEAYWLSPGAALTDRYTRPSLRSWAFRRTSRDPDAWWGTSSGPTFDHAPRAYLVASKDGDMRGYYDEHLNIASAILHSCGLRVDVRYDLGPSPTDHGEWELHTDASLVGSTKEDLWSRYSHRIRSVVGLDAWDSVGTELASRKFAIDDEGARDEIVEFTQSLKGTDQDIFGAHPQKVRI